MTETLEWNSKDKRRKGINDCRIMSARLLIEEEEEEEEEEEAHNRKS